VQLYDDENEDENDFFLSLSKSWSTGGMKMTREYRSTRGKTCPSATLSTTNPTWDDPRLKEGLRGRRPATNRLSHGTALRVSNLLENVFSHHGIPESLLARDTLKLTRFYFPSDYVSAYL
jgi:hypothetical protein